MKVKDLIEFLKTKNPEMECWTSIGNEEGEYYDPIQPREQLLIERWGEWTGCGSGETDEIEKPITQPEDWEYGDAAYIRHIERVQALKALPRKYVLYF